MSVVLPQSLPRCLPPLSSCRLYLVAPRTTAAVRRSATAPTGPTQHLYRRLRHLTCSIQCTNAQTRPRIADFSSTGLGGIVGVTYDDVNVARRRYVQYSRVASLRQCFLPPPPRRPPLPTSARPASAADESTQQAQPLYGAAIAAAAAADTPTEAVKVACWQSQVDTGGGATRRPPALAVVAMRAGAGVTPAAASARDRERMDALTLVPRPQPLPSPSPAPWSGRLPRRRARAAS